MISTMPSMVESSMPISNSAIALPAAASDIIIYDNVTLAEFYRKVNDFSEEEREIALSLIRKINKIIGDDNVKIENIILLGPIVSELLKIANASTDNRIKALTSAQKLAMPQSNVFLQKINVDQSKVSTTTEEEVFESGMEASIFKDVQSSNRISVGNVINDKNHTNESISIDDIEVPYSPSFERKNKGNKAVINQIKIGITGGSFSNKFNKTEGE